MTESQEIVISAAADATLVWDLQTGTILGQLKGNGPTPGRASSLCMAELYPLGVAFAQQDRAFVHFYSMNKSTVQQKCVLPERLSALSYSHTGQLLVGGSESGRILVWNAQSGDLISTLDSHYKSVSAITFTPDDSLLLTAGADSVVHVWSPASLTPSKSSTSGPIKPCLTFSGHSLPITAMRVGMGVQGRSIVYTTSLDRTLLAWDVCSGEQVGRVMFPIIPTALAINETETVYYIGMKSGTIYAHTPYLPSIRTRQPATVQEADAGLQFHGHGKEITQLRLSFDGTKLVSASLDGSCRVFDVESRQCLFTLAHEGGGGVMGLECALRPPWLLEVDGSVEMPSWSIGALKRFPQPTTEGLMITIPGMQGSLEGMNDGSSSSHAAALQDRSLWTNFNSANGKDDDNADLNPRELKRQLAELKGAVDQFYSQASHSLLHQ